MQNQVLTKLRNTKRSFRDRPLLLVFLPSRTSNHTINPIFLTPHLHIPHLALQPSGEDDEPRSPAQDVTGLLESLELGYVCLEGGVRDVNL